MVVRRSPRASPVVTGCIRGVMIPRAFAIWTLLVVLAVLNGGARNAFLTPHWGELSGHVLIFSVSWVSIRGIRPGGPLDALLVGLFWVALTVAFEFLAGHYLFGHSWQKLFADYDLTQGRIWVLVLVANFAAPQWAAWMRRKPRMTNPGSR
jgi:hypothetical protein